MLPRKCINTHDENRLKNEGNILGSKNKILTNGIENIEIKDILIAKKLEQQ